MIKHQYNVKVLQNMPISKVPTYLGIRNRSDIKLSKMLRSTKYFPFLLQNFFSFY